MKILTRTDYKWHDAYFDISTRNIKIENGAFISLTDIVSIKNNVIGKYAQCVHCREIILNTAKNREKHAQKKTTSDTCFTCASLRTDLVSTQSQKYTLLPDGNFQSVNKTIKRLTCANGYKRYDINSEDCRMNCRYHNCSEHTVKFKPLEHFFTKYPKAFDNIATVDALSNKKWKFDTTKQDNFYFYAKLDTN